MGFEPTYIGITIRGLNRLTTSTIGGNGEIRTHGPFRIAGFQDQSHRPLDHVSYYSVLSS